MIQAVVYTSNTGSTEQYARLLGQETGLPVCSLTEARKTLSAGTQILYLGDEETVEQAFSVEAKGNTFFLPGVMSRKKQVIPMLSAIWG